jgi:branched-chain amino acid transport system permease protein
MSVTDETPAVDDEVDLGDLDAANREAEWRPDRRGVMARLAVTAGIVVVVGLTPLLVGDTDVNLVSRAAVYAIVALSMNVIVGYTGQVSLGHQAFLGMGAFGSGYGLTEMGLPWFGALVMAGLTGAVAAVGLGAVALRLAGLYLALVTIAFGLFAQETLFKIRELTGGGAGQTANRPAFFSGDIAYAYLCLIVLLGAILFDWRLVSSRAGRAIQALRDDERVAASWGINVTGYKLLAFVISGILAGIAGALYASIEQVVSSADFTFGLALTFLLMTVVGGVGNRWGVVIGGVFFAILPTLLDRAHANFHFIPFSLIEATWEPAIGALLLLLTLIAYPGGIAQQLSPVLNWLEFRRFSHERHEGSATGGMGARP